MLSQKQLADVCLLYTGNERQCRYLEEDGRTWDWHCTKLRAVTKNKRDATCATFLSECQTKGIDPQKQGVPLGDNCSGYPILKHLEQGYDVD